ncbi:MAG: glycosyltransferase [Coriobacteriales bacterium]|jgi:putative colanic acid biosynthesis glycosyltransferase
MKYVQINAYSGGWAENIVFKKHRELIANGDESWVFWARGNHEQDDHCKRIASMHEVYFDGLQTRIDGKPGFHSKGITRRLLTELEKINPDVVHLHVLTGYYINIEMLFDWLSERQCKINWTLHDCWDFTGHCIYFTNVCCEQWKTGCAFSKSCPQKREYPESWLAGDNTVRKNWEKKRQIFTMLPPERVQLITPSEWLAGLVRQSFLGKYRVKVIHNTVNTEFFKPTPSDFRERFRLHNRTVVLGVASKWSERKGLQDFIRLGNDLDSNYYAVVVIGLSDKQIKQVMSRSKHIVALPKTSTQLDLVRAYSAADILFNPTVEDNYPTVNLESEACGTPVVTYDTGGCRETIHLADSKVAANYDDALNIIKDMRKTGVDSS